MKKGRCMESLSPAGVRPALLLARVEVGRPMPAR
jgi:hypothetical protein